MVHKNTDRYSLIIHARLTQSVVSYLDYVPSFLPCSRMIEGIGTLIPLILVIVSMLIAMFLLVFLAVSSPSKVTTTELATRLEWSLVPNDTSLPFKDIRKSLHTLSFSNQTGFIHTLFDFGFQFIYFQK